MKKEKILKKEKQSSKIPVLSSLQSHQFNIDSMMLQDNLASFIEKGDVFHIYRKISLFLRKKTY